MNTTTVSDVVTTPRCRSFHEIAAAEAALPPDRRIDFVTIVTPNNSHLEPATAFL